MAQGANASGWYSTLVLQGGAIHVVLSSYKTWDSFNRISSLTLELLTSASYRFMTMVHIKEAGSYVDSNPVYLAAGEPNSMSPAKDGTSADVHDMMRMGKQQQTRRNFRHITILGFCMVILSTWEAILATAVFALGNGGTAGLIWGYLICMIGFGFVVASLAEMASM